MASVIWIVVILHIVIAFAVAGAIVAWNAYVEYGRKNTKPLNRDEPS
ncbi:MAG: hypothetical protein K2X34_09345 [Hyphomonadaceae bacterium]|nr:hypothetical protein [Hyphomonadaceae bacterium]